MPDPLERLRRPEYTGENRCWPCTFVNGALLALVVGGLALRGRRLAAATVAVVGTAAVALRGYVVPYTPRFAPRLVAALPIDPFDHADVESTANAGSLSDSNGAADGDDARPPAGEDVLTALLEAGVVALDGDDVVLEPEFREEWRAEMASLRAADLETLAGIADRQTEPSITARANRSWAGSTIVLEGETGAPVSLPRGVAVAELAALWALEDRLDADAVRRAAGRPLRALLEDCPLCDEPLTVSQSSCCGEVTPIGETPSEKLICRACDERFFTFDEPAGDP